MIKKMSCCAKSILISTFLQIKHQVKYKPLKIKPKRKFKITKMKMIKPINRLPRDLKVIIQYFNKLRIYNSIQKIHIHTFSPKIQIQTSKFLINIKDKKSIKIFPQIFSIFYHYYLDKTIISNSYKTNNKSKIWTQMNMKKIRNKWNSEIAIRPKAKILILTKDAWHQSYPNTWSKKKNMKSRN